jgi:signal transduction histidine kinase/two-component SAPR family response regulator
MRSIPVTHDSAARIGDVGPDGDPVAKILAVDDNASNLAALEGMLAELGQPVVCARSGEEALRHLLKEDFAVILLDVVMPGMDGYETAAMIRARDKSRYVPIIFLSAMNEEPAHLTRAYAAGAVDFVFKPINAMILRSKVAVFVELQKRAEEIRRQAALEKRLLADNLLVRTEQRRTEEALQRSLVQQSLVIESLPAVLYVASASDDFRTRRFIGGRLETLVGSAIDASTEPFAWLDRIHAADLPRVLETFNRAAAGAPFSAEYRLLCTDNEYRWFSDRATMNRDNREEQFGLLLDVSDRRVLEEQLAHAQKLEAIGEMTGGVAHDFNNMLSVIMGSLERVLSKPIEDDKMRSRLDLALQAANSCADLTKRLLGFARRQALDPKPIGIADELARLHDMTARLIGKAIKVEIACEDGLWPVYVDSSQLEAAIINLVINARDAMPEGGSLRISSRNLEGSDGTIWRLGLTGGDYVELAVADSGSGMPPEVQARAFEPFFTTKHPGKGTGLGLSTIYGFVQQSGGTAAIESEAGAGTTVYLYLPRAPAANVNGARKSSSGKPASDVLADLHVLLVEDESQVRDLARSMLEEMGCNVTVSDCGDAAIGHLDAPDIALLLTDCMMPGRLDGADLALEARRRRPGLPVLFTSGKWAGVDRIGTDTHNLAFLPKPYTVEQLRSAILALVEADS